MNHSLTRTLSGVYSYNYEYYCGPHCVTGTLTGGESIGISHNKQADVVAVIPILGRLAGPIIQDKGTKTAEEYTISIDLRFPPNTGCSLAYPTGIETEIQSIITSMSLPADKYMRSDVENWNPLTGQYSRNLTYIIENC
jgi:hypothetical protein